MYKLLLAFHIWGSLHIKLKNYYATWSNKKTRKRLKANRKAAKKEPKNKGV